MLPMRDTSNLHFRYQLDRDFYARVRAAKPQYKLVEKFTIPPYSGQGFIVKSGQAFRVIEEEGPQIGDVALWNAHDPREVISATHTWELEGWVVRVYSRLWSVPPWLRPMATCIEDTVVTMPPGSDYQHHYQRTHCNSEWREMRTGRAGLNSCHLNFLQAIEPFGLKEEDICDNFMVHQKVYLDPKTGKKYNMHSDGKRGDFIEIYAEMDLLVAVSVCPYGDAFSDVALGKLYEDKVRPLGIELYETGIEPKGFPSRRGDA